MENWYRLRGTLRCVRAQVQSLVWSVKMAIFDLLQLFWVLAPHRLTICFRSRIREVAILLWSWVSATVTSKVNCMSPSIGFLINRDWVLSIWKHLSGLLLIHFVFPTSIGCFQYYVVMIVYLQKDAKKISSVVELKRERIKRRRVKSKCNERTSDEQKLHLKLEPVNEFFFCCPSVGWMSNHLWDSQIRNHMLIGPDWGGASFE